MNIGKLRNRLAVHMPPSSADVDEIGQPLDAWPLLATTWASIEPLFGRELFRAQQVNSEVTTRIRMRYRSDVDRSMVGKFRGKTFDFLYIIEPDFSRKELLIMCKERQ